MSIKAKVDRLEEALIRLAESEERLHREFLEFKEEMRAFKGEMREFKEEMRSFKNELNKKWGWVINRLGTLEEDLFYPSFSDAIKKHFGIELTESYMRVKKA